MAISRHTYKQELIEKIEHMFRKSSLKQLPPSCLTDMSTASLAAFLEWIEPVLEANPTIPSSQPALRLPAGKPRKR